MKKIPTLFIREFENHKVVKITKEFSNDECKKAFLEGKATVKFDGSCCAVINGKFYKRYDAKKGKPIPEGAIKCQEKADEITGHLPCWIEVRENDSSNKWFIEAFKNYEKLYGKPKDGTYEAIGKHFQGNPYKFNYEILVPHGEALCKLEIRTFESVKKYLAENPQEGIVFWLNEKPVCKIKRTDFGFQWPIREDKSNEKIF